MNFIFIPATEIVERFFHLLKEGESVTGLQFARAILGCNEDSREYLENCASSVAMTVYEVSKSHSTCSLKELFCNTDSILRNTCLTVK